MATQTSKTKTRTTPAKPAARKAARPAAPPSAPARKTAPPRKAAARKTTARAPTKPASGVDLLKPGSAAAVTATERIVEAITTAIVERRLMPGTKLGEQKIADIFRVSRTIVRQALNQLSRHKLVVLEPARGAFVATPSVEEARQVFEVRRLLESAVIRELVPRISAAQIEVLRTHLREEQAAVDRRDVAARTRLLGDFHVVIARMLGNETLAEYNHDLASRSSLISLMYQSANSAEHSFEEHVAIVEAIARRDVRTAVRLTEQHLVNVERNLRLDPRVPLDLESALLPV